MPSTKRLPSTHPFSDISGALSTPMESMKRRRVSVERLSPKTVIPLSLMFPSVDSSPYFPESLPVVRKDPPGEMAKQTMFLRDTLTNVATPSRKAPPVIEQPVEFDQQENLKQRNEIADLVTIDLKNEQHPSTVVKALKRLHKMMDASCAKNEGDKKIIKKEMIRIGAPAIIVAAMTRWQARKEIQLSCCACLSRMAYKDDEGGCVIAKSKGVVAVTRAMQTFPNSLHIQRFGCAALSNILANHSDEQIQEASRYFVHKVNGLEIIQEAMVTFSSDPTLQARCLGLCSNIACTKDFHKALRDAGVSAQVVKATERHGDDDKVQRQASALLTKLQR